MRTFYQLTDTEGFEILKTKVDIVEQLMSPPASLSYIESIYQDYGLGKKAAREIAAITTKAVFILILISVTLFLLSPIILSELGVGENLSLILQRCIFLAPIILYLFFLNFYKYYLRFKAPEDFNSERELLEKITAIKTKENQIEFDKYFVEAEKLNVRKRAIYLCLTKDSKWLQKIALLNVPFALRNIWLWSFVIAVFTIFFNKNYEIHFHESFSDDKFFSFMTDFFRALLIAVVAYIATNVISELLQLREQYVEGKKQSESLKNTINYANKQMEKTVNNVEIIYNISDVSKNLRLLQETFSKANPLANISSDFTKTISEQLRIFNNKVVTGVNDDEIINTWFFSALNQYLIKTSEELQKETSSFITKFQFFGQILNETIGSILKNDWFLENFKKQYEIYTVLVLPPERFLNYNIKSTIPEKDVDWDKFIHTCINAKKQNFDMNRHFLVINFNKSEQDTVTKYFGRESEKLESESFKEQLKKRYYYSEKKPDNQTIFNENNSYIEVMKEEKEGYEKQTLAEILTNIHNSCKAIELKLPDSLTTNNGESKLANLDDLLWDKKTHKALDYLAIKKKGVSNGWVFCFQTVLDESFDFAYIKLYHSHSEAKEWSEICKNLSKIFLIDKQTPGSENDVLKDDETGISIYPINKY